MLMCIPKTDVNNVFFCSIHIHFDFIILFKILVSDNYVIYKNENALTTCKRMIYDKKENKLLFAVIFPVLKIT